MSRTGNFATAKNTSFSFTRNGGLAKQLPGLEASVTRSGNRLSSRGPWPLEKFPLALCPNGISTFIYGNVGSRRFRRYLRSILCPRSVLPFPKWLEMPFDTPGRLILPRKTGSFGATMDKLCIQLGFCSGTEREIMSRFTRQAYLLSIRAVQRRGGR